MDLTSKEIYKKYSEEFNNEYKKIIKRNDNLDKKFWKKLDGFIKKLVDIFNDLEKDKYSDKIGKIIDEARWILIDANNEYSVEAAYLLGSDLLNSKPKDGIKLLKFSSDNNNTDALDVLGDYYMKELDYEQAYKCFSKSTELGSYYGHGQLGYMYECGLYVEKDLKEAIRLYKIAAEGSYSGAKLLGDCYFEGIGVKQDYSKALKYLKEYVDEAGDSADDYDKGEACEKIAKIYFNGVAGKKNYKESKKYYALANEYGYDVYDLEKIFKCIDKVSENDEILNVKKVINCNPKSDKYYQQATKLSNAKKYKEAFNVALKGAKLGYGFCINFIANDYYFNENNVVNTNKEFGLQLYELAANAGVEYSLNNLGYIYYQEAEKENKKSSYALAFKYLKPIADKKCECQADATYMIGKCYQNGHGIKKDIDKAIQYFKKSLSLKNYSGAFQLGWHYCEGLGVKKDVKKGIEYYEIAAKNGSLGAMRNLGVHYKYGMGVKKDMAIACEWFDKYLFDEETYDLNQTEYFELDPDIAESMGYEYHMGKNIERNYSKAFKCYEYAFVNFKDSFAFNLALLYDEGHGTEKDWSQAESMYRIAAEKYDNGNAWCIIGDHYREEGMFIDEAIGYYEKGADLGNTSCMFWLGMYYSGELGGIFSKNYRLAVKYYQMGADKDSKECLNNLGILYQKGLGVPKDIYKANELYERASQLGNDLAKGNLERNKEHLSKLQSSNRYW